MATPATIKARREKLQERGLLSHVVATCRDHHASVEDVLKGSRTKCAVRARRALCREFRTRYQMSYPEIGELLCIDHSTVIYAVKRE